MTFLGEIFELYLQLGNFFENSIPTLNQKKASMIKTDVSCYFHSSPRGAFRTLLNIYGGNIFAKMVNNFKSINVFVKSSVSDGFSLCIN